MKKFKQFEKKYNEAIKIINSFLNGPESMKGLANWLINTDHNPYSFLPENYAAGFCSAEGFASLLHMIHHAVEDDGDICFLTIGGTPAIRFVDRHSDNLEEKVLSREHLRIKEQIEQTADRWEKYFGKEIEKTPYVEVLNIKPNEFGPIYDESIKQDEERWRKYEDFKNTIKIKLPSLPSIE